MRSIGSALTLVAAGAAALLIIGPAAQASVHSRPSRTYVTNRPVYTVASTEKAIYIGGSFTEVGPRTGPGVGIDSSTGKSRGFAQVDGGRVYAVAPDGAGGYYVGGLFTHVGGLARHNLAHIRADGTVDPSFKANPNNEVEALAVSGSTIYAGGYFTRIGGQSRNNIAALNGATGKATAWNPNPPNHHITALAVSGSIVYVGGDFDHIGGEARNNLAALDRSTGEATAWDPDPSLHGSPGVPINALAVAGSTVYAGGYFDRIGGEARNNLAALDQGTGEATAWDPDATNSLLPCGSPGHPYYPIPYACGSSAVTALAIAGSTVYAGGSFDRIGGEVRNRLAAIDRATGNPTAWDPDPSVDSNPGAVINALAVSGSTVYAGGWFTTIGGKARNNLAAVDRATGQATGWNPKPNVDRDEGPSVAALAVSGSTVYAGGTFGRSTSRLATASLPSTRPPAGRPRGTLTPTVSSHIWRP